MAFSFPPADRAAGARPREEGVGNRCEARRSLRGAKGWGAAPAWKRGLPRHAFASRGGGGGAGCHVVTCVDRLFRHDATYARCHSVSPRALAEEEKPVST